MWRRQTKCEDVSILGNIGRVLIVPISSKMLLKKIYVFAAALTCRYGRRGHNESNAAQAEVRSSTGGGHQGYV